MHHQTLIAAVSTITGGTFIGLDTCTDVPLTGGKKNPMQGRITKKVIGSTVMAFTNQNINAYEAMVKRRLDAEGKDPEAFVLKERKWGVRIPNMPIVEHNGAYYFEAIFIRAGAVSYYLDGFPIAESAIEGLKGSVSAGGQGGLDNKVIIRDYKCESIIEMRIDGKVIK